MTFSKPEATKNPFSPCLVSDVLRRREPEGGAEPLLVGGEQVGSWQVGDVLQLVLNGPPR